ncbi:MAG: hypothetical protein ACOC9S_05370 [Planctomycetota bacterium]
MQISQFNTLGSPQYSQRGGCIGLSGSEGLGIHAEGVELNSAGGWTNHGATSVAVGAQGSATPAVWKGRDRS